MPEAVLDGRLGELCERSMGDCPRASAWASLLVCAGTLVAGERTLPTNLFVALVGPVGSGKTQAAVRAMRSFEMNPENDAPPILRPKAGSGEGLLNRLS